MVALQGRVVLINKLIIRKVMVVTVNKLKLLLSKETAVLSFAGSLFLNAINGIGWLGITKVI